MNESPYSPTPTNSPYSPQPQPPSPPRTPYDAAPNVTPSGWWYLLSAAFFVAGLIAAILLIIHAANIYVGASSSIQYVPAPGQTEVYLDKPGLYSVYLSQSTMAGEQALVPDALSISVHPVGQPEPLELLPADANRTFFSLNDRILLSLHRFTLDQPGAVVIVAKPVEGREDLAAPMELGVGMDFGVTKALKMFYYIFGGLAAGIGGFILALLIFIITIIKRSACKRRMLTAAGRQHPPIM